MRRPSNWEVKSRKRASTSDLNDFCHNENPNYSLSPPDVGACTMYIVQCIYV